MQFVRALFALGLVLLLSGCGEGLTRCDPADPGSNCGRFEICAWHLRGENSGYFCGRSCDVTNPCPGGNTCTADAATACDICTEAFGLCE